MLLIIDNYDSFTYNLVQYFGELGADVRVYRNRSIGCEDIVAMRPNHIVISPGPCAPQQAGVSLAVIERFAGQIPLLGVCLGHQSIGEVFGAQVVRARIPVHGKVSAVYHDGQGVFAGLPSPFNATRYHSLVVDRHSLPGELLITAETAEGEIMGLRHKSVRALEGVQFHPEAILTEHGKPLLRNFLQWTI